MSDAFEIARVGMGAQDRALNVLAANIANVNTPSFKCIDASFSAMVMADMQTGAMHTAGVRMDATPSFTVQGEMQATNNPLDLAIDGEGFIELLGPGGEVHLWRGGRLAISPDGSLMTAEGQMLRAAISVPFDATTLSIADDGLVTAMTAQGDPLELGAIELVRVTSPSALEPVSGSTLKVLDASMVRSSPAGEEGAGRLRQGMIERSNVDLNDEMVSLMILQRAYAANAQVLQVADQVISITNNLRQR